MNNHTLTVETEDGEQFVADIEDFNIEIEREQYCRELAMEYRKYHFKVGTLFNTDTGEKY